MKPRRRLDYYDDEEDEEELLEWVSNYFDQNHHVRISLVNKTLRTKTLRHQLFGTERSFINPRPPPEGDRG